MDGIRSWFGSVDWQSVLERFSNERIVAFFTGPYGLATLGALLLVSVIYKKRFLFVAIAGSLAVAFVARYSLAGHELGPSRHIFLLAGGGVAVAAFVIYFLFIRDE